MDKNGQRSGGQTKEIERMKKEKRHGELSPPAQVTCQGLIEGRGSRNQLVVNGRVAALFAHLVDELLNDFPIGVANGTRVGDDFEVHRFEILEKNISVEGKIQLRLIQEMKNND